MAKITRLCFVLLIFIIACNDHDSASAYDELLSRPPYASLTDSIKQDPANDSLYFRRAILLNQDNLPQPALADFRKAWSLRKNEGYALGISTLLAENTPDSAVKFLREALPSLPQSLLLRVSLARTYASLNKNEEALQVCDELLQQYPQQVDVMKLKSSLLDAQAKPAEATRILEQAYEITPADVQLNYMLALHYAEAGKARVLKLCDSLILLDTRGTHAEPYYYKGIYYSNTGENRQAMAQFDEAIRHDYNFLDAYIEKAALQFSMKQYTEALQGLNLALTVSPEFADTYYWIAKCQQAIGKPDEAKLNYQRAFGLDPGFSAARDSANKLK